ncbi:MAG: lipoprotein-releasing ABC transporter permease subunit [Steroidobacteraceae bacterium]
MSTRVEWMIARRYLSSRHRNRFVSFISGISMGGLALGVTALVVVLSVINGFERELRERILDTTAHATLTAFNGTMKDWRHSMQVAAAQPGVAAVAPFIEDKGMLVNGRNIAGAIIRGVLPADESRVDGIATRMSAGMLGELASGGYRIVLGRALAEALQVKVGDRLVLMSPQAVLTPLGAMPRMRRFTVSGIFNAGMYEYDRGLALVHLEDLARLTRKGDAVTGLRLKVDNVYAARTVAVAVARSLEDIYYASDWQQTHQNFFRSITLTKTIMFVVLSLVVFVGAFNIVSTLVMVVKDKQGDVAILRTLGGSPASVMQIFIYQGAAIGLIGTAIGIGLGVLIAVNTERLVHGLERLLGTTLIDASVYFIGDLPARVEWADIGRIALVALGLCCLATLYPAWRAARNPPAEALRHE